MAKAPAKKTDADQDLDALRERVAAILHSNGFDGQKGAEEIVAAVGEHIGGDLSPKEEKTEE